MHTERATDEQFSTYMRRYQPGAYATAARMLGDLDDADDVVQDAFRRTHRDGAPASEPEFRELLMYRVRRLAKNFKARGRRREQRRAAWVFASAGMEAQDMEAAELTRVDAEAALRALTGLPEMQRICFQLIVVGGRSSEEVARLYRINGVTARQHAARARKALAARFGSRAHGHSETTNG